MRHPRQACHYLSEGYSACPSHPWRKDVITDTRDIGQADHEGIIVRRITGQLRWLIVWRWERWEVRGRVQRLGGGMVGDLDSSLLQVGIPNVVKVGETGYETEGALLGGQSVIDQVMA